MELALTNGVLMPQIGLGVYKSAPGAETVDAVRYAIECGYRHIDTASFYQNEASVGEGIRRSGIDRDDVFVTTKVWPDAAGYESTLAAFERSMAELQMDYVDLYLIHWPVPGKNPDTWRALQELEASGRARAIGVSNFMRSHLEDMTAWTDELPAVNQIELTPYLYGSRLPTIEWCTAEGVVVEAYSPLARGTRLDDLRLADIAATYDKTAAQVLIRWAIQHGFVVIPKSVNPARIASNFDVFDFELSPDHMAALDGWDENLMLTDRDPDDIEV